MADPFFLKTYVEEKQWLSDETGRAANPLVPKNDPRLKADYTTQAGKLKRQQGTVVTWNQKTRSLSFDITSLKTCPGAAASLAATKAGGMGICTLCYASKGPYAFENVKTTMDMRLALTKDADFVDTMIHILKTRRREYISTGRGEFAYHRESDDPRFFRVHSSGDLYSAEYVEKWHAICSAFPQTLFWFPTRVWAAPTAVIGRMTPALVKLTSLDNVILRPSMLQFNEFPQHLVSRSGIRWSAPSGALIFADLNDIEARIGAKSKRLSFKGEPQLEDEWRRQGVWFCPATPRDHDGKKIADTWNCVTQKCRRCWTHPDLPVVYRVH